MIDMKERNARIDKLGAFCIRNKIDRSDLLALYLANIVNFNNLPFETEMMVGAQVLKIKITGEL